MGAAKAVSMTGADVRPEHSLAKTDEAEKQPMIANAQTMRAAANASGKSPFAMLREMMKLSRGPGKLTTEDYLTYRLYDPNLSEEEKLRFASDNQHWRIAGYKINERWLGVTEDKFFCSTLLSATGLPTPETQAVIEPDGRTFGATPALRTSDELAAFLREDAQFPLFGKPNAGVCSYGVRLITGIDGDHVIFEGAEPAPVADFFEGLTDDTPYLLQSRLFNHDAIAALTPYLATVRLVHLVEPDAVQTPFAAIKIPSKTNIADNYWRAGNVLADIDVASGVIKRAITGKGPQTVDLETFPETDAPLIGLELPFWREAIELGVATARVFAMQAYQSLDLALTPTGPVIVEVNSGGAFELPQLASGKGVLTDEVKAFFNEAGAKL
ncbi:MAG: sugar-transfer associated ATP-grasp domain-containing protein [Pseudomonadota bacterium]